MASIMVVNDEPELVEILYGEVKPKEKALKATGMFGPEVTPPPGADIQTQLLAVFGRVV